jgi:hypothetical protein
METIVAHYALTEARFLSVPMKTSFHEEIS